MKSQFVSAWVALILTLASCTSSKTSINMQNTEVGKLSRDQYVVLDKNIEVEAKSFIFWLLFIKFSGKSDQRLYEKAYNKAVKSAGKDVDGILNPRPDYKSWRVPLIVTTFGHKRLTLTGKPYRLKTEQEMKESKTNK